MKNLLVGILALSSWSAFATCMIEVTTCSSEVSFMNTYSLKTITCAAPGGRPSVTSTFSIYNPLVNQCGPVAHEGCVTPIFQGNLDTGRMNYFQASFKLDENKVSLLIDDRRIIPQGAFHVSTPNADYFVLEGYTCSAHLF